MNITEIAKDSTEIFSLYISNELSETMQSDIEEFYEAVNDKFAEDDDEQANESLQLFETNPKDEKLKAALADFLVKKAEADERFEETLTLGVYEFFLT